jgi:diguanylate cyclase (GGDEF)-like protein
VIGSARVVGVLAPSSIQSTIGRLSASEYVQVGQGRRFRAVQRHRTRTASRAGFLVVAAAVGFDAAALVGLDAGGSAAAIGLDALVLGAALVGWWMLPRRLRHHPEIGAFAVMLGVTISTVVTGLLVPALSVQTVAYLLLLPGLISLVLPWATQVHLAWLLGFTIVAAGYLLASDGRFTSDERGDLMVVLIVAIGASVAGHMLLQRAQIHSFAQLERIRALRRRSDADRVELERVHHALELTARIDPLTGAGNRRRLDEDLRAVRAHIGRSGMRYGLLEIDLDHFKGINDTLGHLAGDDVLCRVVTAIQGTLRGTDAVYRYGGEEFVVILPVPDRDGLLAAADRLRATVFDLDILHPASPRHGRVSVSIGALMLGSEDLTESDAEWFRRTDQALYQAKEDGRNLVRFAA